MIRLACPAPFEVDDNGTSHAYERGLELETCPVCGSPDGEECACTYDDLMGAFDEL